MVQEQVSAIIGATVSFVKKDCSGIDEPQDSKVLVT